MSDKGFIFTALLINSLEDLIQANDWYNQVLNILDCFCKKLCTVTICIQIPYR